MRSLVICLLRICKYCFVEFKQGYQQPKEYDHRYYGISFCSRKCEDNYKGNKLTCPICNKEFYRTNKLRVCCSYSHSKDYMKIKIAEQNKKRNNLYGWFSRTIHNKYDGNSKKPFKTIELINHLEKQFDINMSWDNYGKYWHIDHLIPLSWFNNKKQAIKFGWRLKNLRPIPAKENISKSNKYVGIAFDKDFKKEIIYL